MKPDPQNSKTRADNQAARNVQAPKNTSPRLHIDSSGTDLAGRSQQPSHLVESDRHGLERVRGLL